ncbi:hypothetical protein PLICRDRAFT_158656 [Plicaturopsis crispa FD-325 SS-3]|nr:hypothetical protein PLICRDRAFT_158656 [Plicaturopsis crispa FD-325 SS-3]
MTVLEVELKSRARLFPSPPSCIAHTTPLSIVDATVSRFTPTSAVWFYDSLAESPTQDGVLTPGQLTRALETTLHAYPQWAGQLHWATAPYDAQQAKRDHTTRFGRLAITYGGESDPGVELVVAHSPRILSALVPTAGERMAAGIWDASRLPLSELLPTTPPLALHNLSDYTGLPCMIVQLTTLDCGGIAIAVALAHPLADAQSLLQFMHDWAAVNRALRAHASAPVLSPVFEPSLLDRTAAGNIDAAESDPNIIVDARMLPIHRYDWWASARDCPFPTKATQTPSALHAVSVEPLGPPLPWAEWDVAAPVDHYMIYFSADEVRRIWEDASRETSVLVSRLDSLLAHIWTLVIRARGLESDPGDMHLDVTFGLRPRVSPALPDAFLGSPLMITHVTTTGLASCTSSRSLGTLAASIRTTVAQFTPTAISAVLHELAYELAPQRRWNAFLGRRNSIVTSWLRLGMYALDFGAGSAPRYAEAAMPSVDGCIQVMERGPAQENSGHWCEDGVSVSLHLKEDVMQNLLNDPLLRRYASSGV